MKKKILVIDHDQDILELTEFLLKEMDYDVDSSLNADILDDVLQIKPDLILLDDWLGGTSGHELCKKLKSEVATSHIKILIFSASTGLEKIAKENLADSYIEKPFDIVELESRILNLLKGVESVREI